MGNFERDDPVKLKAMASELDRLLHVFVEELLLQLQGQARSEEAALCRSRFWFGHRLHTSCAVLLCAFGGVFDVDGTRRTASAVVALEHVRPRDPAAPPGDGS